MTKINNTTQTSSFTSSFSSAQRIPTTTFDSILPPTKLSTWDHEDVKGKPKRSSKELASKAKSRFGDTVKLVLNKADVLKKEMGKAKDKRNTDKEIKRVAKEKEKGIKEQREAEKK